MGEGIQQNGRMERRAVQLGQTAKDDHESLSQASWKVCFLTQDSLDLTGDDGPGCLHMLPLYICAAQCKSQHVLTAHFCVYNERFPSGIYGLQESSICCFTHTLQSTNPSAQSLLWGLLFRRKICSSKRAGQLETGEDRAKDRQ